MRPLPLQDYLKSILDYNPDTGIFKWIFTSRDTPWELRWAGKEAAVAFPTIEYRMIYLPRYQVCFKAHRLAWMMHYGEDPGEMQIDHINNIKTDNRICNLRVATNAQNQWNRDKPKGINPYKGVFQNRKGPWYFKIGTGIRANAVVRYGFKSAEEARDARNLLLESIHGEFKRAS